MCHAQCYEPRTALADTAREMSVLWSRIAECRALKKVHNSKLHEAGFLHTANNLHASQNTKTWLADGWVVRLPWLVESVAIRELLPMGAPETATLRHIPFPKPGPSTQKPVLSTIANIEKRKKFRILDCRSNQLSYGAMTTYGPKRARTVDLQLTLASGCEVGKNPILADMTQLCGGGAVRSKCRVHHSLSRKGIPKRFFNSEAGHKKG